MNCKPGDLAIIVSDSVQYNGRIVEVLHAVPAERFTLPDGYPAINDQQGPAWVLKFIGGPAIAPLVGGGTRKTLYAVGIDSRLKPLRGDPDEVPAEPVAESIS